MLDTSWAIDLVAKLTDTLRIAESSNRVQNISIWQQYKSYTRNVYRNISFTFRSTSWISSKFGNCIWCAEKIIISVQVKNGQSRCTSSSCLPKEKRPRCNPARKHSPQSRFRDQAINFSAPTAPNFFRRQKGKNPTRKYYPLQSCGHKVTLIFAIWKYLKWQLKVTSSQEALKRRKHPRLHLPQSLPRRWIRAHGKPVLQVLQALQTRRFTSVFTTGLLQAQRDPNCLKMMFSQYFKH